jgi:hypothetical protein
VHTRVELNDSSLVVKGSLYSRSIGIEEFDLEKARVADLIREPELQARRRTNGIGLPGYQAGWFRLRNERRALLFLTKKEKVLYLPSTGDYDVLLSLARPAELLESVNANS